MHVHIVKQRESVKTVLRVILFLKFTRLTLSIVDETPVYISVHLNLHVCVGENDGNGAIVV